MDMDRKVQSEVVAATVRAMADRTTAEQILCLNRLYEMGWRRGFSDGAISGSKHTAETFDLITRAMAPREPTPHGT
jgi:hypothetical protein